MNMEERYLYEVHPVRPVKVNGRFTRVPFSINLSKSEVREYMKFGGVFRRFGGGGIVKVTGENLDSLHVPTQNADPDIVPKPQTEINLDITHSSETTTATKIEKEVEPVKEEEEVKEEKKPNIIMPSAETVDTTDTEESKEEEFPKEEESSSISDEAKTAENDSEEAIPVDTEETVEKAENEEDNVAEDTNSDAATTANTDSQRKDGYIRVGKANSNQNNNYNRKHNKNRH